MHVVIVGADRIGSALARRLTEEDHSVAIIDKNRAAFDRFLTDWGGDKIAGYGFDRDRLEEAGIEKAGALAAVTGGDNSNIIVARIAKETYGVANVVARIKDPRRASVYERLGISTVSTVEWTTDQAIRRMMPEATRPDWVHSSGGVVVLERRLPDGWVGRRVADAGRSGRWRVVGLTRLGRAVLPEHDVIGQADDRLILAVAGDALPELEAVLEAVDGSAGPGGAHS